VADIDSLTYGRTLLDNELLHGCMRTTERVAEAAVTGKLPGTNLRNISLVHDYSPGRRVVAGVFACSDERDRYVHDRALNLLWVAFANAPTRSTAPCGAPIVGHTI
jgi:hypothetical protein